jgi:hypothetical protein
MTGALMWQFVKWHKLIGDNLADRFLRKPLPAPSARDRQLEQLPLWEARMTPASRCLPVHRAGNHFPEPQ